MTFVVGLWWDKRIVGKRLKNLHRGQERPEVFFPATRQSTSSRKFHDGYSGGENVAL